MTVTFTVAVVPAYRSRVTIVPLRRKTTPSSSSKIERVVTVGRQARQPVGLRVDLRSQTETGEQPVRGAVLAGQCGIGGRSITEVEGDHVSEIDIRDVHRRFDVDQVVAERRIGERPARAPALRESPRSQPEYH